MSFEAKIPFAAAGRIALLATVLGFAYNGISPHGISLIRSPHQLTMAADSASTVTPSTTKPLGIDVQQAEAFFREGKTLFFDTRHEIDYVQGHIQGAYNLPLELLKEKPGVVSSLNKDVQLVVYCGGEECDLSTDVGMKLAEMGFRNVRIFLAGWLEWKRLELPLEYGPPPPIP